MRPNLLKSGGRNVLVNQALVLEVRVRAPQPQKRDLFKARVWLDVTADEAEAIRIVLADAFLDLRLRARVEPFIGIEPQRPIRFHESEQSVQSLREVVGPLDFMDLRS